MIASSEYLIVLVFNLVTRYYTTYQPKIDAMNVS